MTKVLVTGGSGFIAAHIINQLLEQQHQVITTVRSEEKAQQIRDLHPNHHDQLQIAIVPDISKPNAFNEVVKTPGIDVVLHTASPFHFNWSDAQTELIDPALIGTTGILQAVTAFAPSVKRVVITSSFAAVLDEAKMSDPNTTFTESSWNPVGLESLQKDKATAYRISKKVAEEAAWEFVGDKAASGAQFDIVAVNPPLVTGPVAHHLGGLDRINTSNARVVDAIMGKWRSDGAIASGGALVSFVDVRDAARAHIAAGLELPEAGGQRLLTVSSEPLSNRAIYEIIRRNFPEYVDKLPPPDATGGEAPESHYKIDNSKTTSLLGIKWRGLEESIVDTVQSLKKWSA